MNANYPAARSVALGFRLLCASLLIVTLPGPAFLCVYFIYLALVRQHIVLAIGPPFAIAQPTILGRLLTQLNKNFVDLRLAAEEKQGSGYN